MFRYGLLVIIPKPHTNNNKASMLENIQQKMFYILCIPTHNFDLRLIMGNNFEDGPLDIL